MTTITLTQLGLEEELRIVNAALEDNDAKATELLEMEHELAAKRAELQEQERMFADEKAKVIAQATTLSAQKIEILALLQSLPVSVPSKPVPLIFDNDKQTICWAGGNVKLGKIPFRFVKVLYFAKKRRLKIETVDKRVWLALKGRQSTDHRTICRAFYRLQGELKAANFPYEIVNVKNEKKVFTHTDMVTQQERQVVVEPEVKGFKLRAKHVLSQMSQG